jgi:hypothetical protein
MACDVPDAWVLWQEMQPNGYNAIVACLLRLLQTTLPYKIELHCLDSDEYGISIQKISLCQLLVARVYKNSTIITTDQKINKFC